MAKNSQNYLWTIVASKFPKLTRNHTVLLAVVLVLGYFAYSWLQEKPSASNRTASSRNDSKASGSGAVSIAGIGNVSGDVSISVNKGSELKPTFEVKFRPIDRLEERLDTIRFPGESETISLRFVSAKWDIDRLIDIPQSTPVGRVSTTLLLTLQLAEHVDVDTSNLPTPKGTKWSESWVLHLNGMPLNDDKETFESLAAKSGDMLQFYLSFKSITLTTKVTPIDDTVVPELLAPTPPDLVPL